MLLRKRGNARAWQSTVQISGPDPAACFADKGVTAALLPSQSWLGVEESQSDQTMAETMGNCQERHTTVL